MSRNDMAMASDTGVTTPYEATVVITTINRKDDLRRSIRSAMEQIPPVEIVVICDGSPKEIIDMVSAEFPGIRLFHTSETMGISVQRNWGAQLATAPIIFSIDDDAAFTSSDTVSRTLKAFENPLVGAVFLPFIDVFRDKEHGTNVPEDHDDIYVAYAFVGTAYALRKELFLRLGGVWEEDDYCARLLDAGYVIRCGDTDPVHHFVSPIRSWERIAFLGARNAILYTYMNVPRPYLMLHLMGTSMMNVISGIRKKTLLTTLKGLATGYRDCISANVERRPVSRNTYRLIRRLRKQGPTRLSSVRNVLNRPLFG